MNPENAPAFNTPVYTLNWDATNNRYSKEITGLGDYKTCTSNNSSVSITPTTNGVLITSSKEVRNEATITCSYTVGSGTNDLFYYFEFQAYGNCINRGACQNILYGSGKKTYSKSFAVKSEGTKLKIKKVGLSNKTLSGAEFRLTHRTTTNYSVVIAGNASAATELNKTGEYIVSETKTPAGYEKITDFNIKIDASTNKITKCTNQGSDASGNTTCMKGQVVVTYASDGTIILSIVDVAKNFKIQKLNKNNKGIKGATFQIRNSSNTPMRFSLQDNNIFAYDANGSITNIKLDNSSSYPIALLPEGEYKLVETAVPFPYRLSSKEAERTTKIKINANRDMLVYDESQNTSLF